MSAGSRTPRERAEACFALARSATIAGERDAAVSRGIVICGKHGFDLDTFDIPGRRRAAARTRPKISAIEINVVGDSPSAFAAAMSALKRALDEASRRTGAAEDETPHDAARRNFDRACADASQRDRTRDGDPRA